MRSQGIPIFHSSWKEGHFPLVCSAGNYLKSEFFTDCHQSPINLLSIAKTGDNGYHENPRHIISRI